METISGKNINLDLSVTALEPLIDFHDIAWALSRLPRYAGHTIDKHPYNVADHSILVYKLYKGFCNQNELGKLLNDVRLNNVCLSELNIPKNINKLLFLLHDAHEYLTSDIPSDIKKQIIKNENKDINSKNNIGVIKSIENKIDSAIAIKLGLSGQVFIEKKDIIKIFDNIAFKIESYYFLHSRGVNFKEVTIDNKKLLFTTIKKTKSNIKSYNKFIKILNKELNHV